MEGRAGGSHRECCEDLGMTGLQGAGGGVGRKPDLEDLFIPFSKVWVLS